jgi:predicted PurR-regulated permease PerM
VPSPAPGPTVAPAAWVVRGIFVIALVFGVREARTLLAPIVVAVMLTFVLAPAVRQLRRLGVPEVLGAGLLVLALIGSTLTLSAGLAAPAAEWWQKAPSVVGQLLSHVERLRAVIPGLEPPAPLPLPRPGGRASASNPPAVVPAPDPVKERLASEGVALTGALLGHSVALTLSVAATVILLYFLLASEHWMLSRCVEAIPRRRTRALVLGGVRAAQREIGRYLVAVGCINACAGAITGLALWWLGLPNPTLWAAIVALLCFIPYLGPLIVMAMLLAAGVMTFGELPAMLGPLAVFASIHALESNIVSPLVVGHRLSLSPISVFLSVIFWGWLWGIVGALIAVPVLIALRSVCLRSRGLRLLSRFLEGDRREPPTLRSLLRPRSRQAAAKPLGAAQR